MRIILARLIRVIHFGFLLFILSGWAFSNPKIIICHLIFIPLMILQWRYNEGTCYLTNLENWVKGVKRPKHEEQGQFIKSILSKWYDPIPSEKTIKIWLHVIIWASWALSLAKIFILKDFF